MFRSLYIMAYITVAVIVTVQAVLQLMDGTPVLATVGVLLTSAPISLMIGAMMVLNNRARTSDRLTYVAGLAWLGVVLAAYHHYGQGGSIFPLTLAALMTGLYYLYDYWYARLERGSSNVTVGDRLPSFDLVSPDGETISSDTLVGKPAILVFYRGNWCPLCVAQVKEIAGRYNELKNMGVRVLLVSPQSQRHTETIADKFAASMEFYRDADNAAAKKLGIENRYGTPFGMQALGYSSHTVLPTVIITDSNGIVQWVHETDNYRVRPEPDTYIAVLKEKGLVQQSA